MEQGSPFYAAEGLHVEIYDELFAEDRVGFAAAGDVAFYLAEAERTGGPILDVACGTGRVAWPLAAAGFEVEGIDRSEAMLRRARAKLTDGTSPRFTLADMRDFSLGREFSLAVVPFRGFQALLDPADQRAALGAIHSHLRLDGVLIVDVFDPRLDLLVDSNEPRPVGRVTHPDRGSVVEVTVVARDVDYFRQVLAEVWRFTEISPGGDVVWEDLSQLELRWSFRPEMAHLFELCGFRVVDEFSDFDGSPPAYGGEQIWVVQRI